MILYPLILIAATVTAWAIFTARRLTRTSQRHAARQCIGCGYDLRGSGNTCPECGEIRPGD